MVAMVSWMIDNMLLCECENVLGDLTMLLCSCISVLGGCQDVAMQLLVVARGFYVVVRMF